jgi:hypothetical protein
MMPARKLNSIIEVKSFISKETRLSRLYNQNITEFNLKLFDKFQIKKFKTYTFQNNQFFK